MEKLKNLTKKQKAIIISAVSIVMVAVISVVGVFAYKKYKLNMAESTTTTTTETSTEETATIAETTETTTETTTKKVAAPVTKPYKPKNTTTTKPETVATKYVKINVPFVKQIPDYPTGCEAASATMLLKYYGYNVTLDEMVAAIPRENLYEENGKVYGPSIYEKFVGDPRYTYTSETPGYGAFSPVITKSLNNVIARKGNRHTAKNIIGCSFSTLIKHLDEGRPIIVWATGGMRTPTLVNSWYIKNADGTETYFEYPRGTHVTVLVGYDSHKVYMLDPYHGEKSYSHSAFIDKWNLLGNQAIILVDKTPETVTTTTTTTTTTTVPETTTQTTTNTTTETTTETTTVTDTSASITENITE